MPDPAATRSAKPRSLFPLFLSVVFVIFLGLLAYTWIGAEQAKPVILDEHGQPRNRQ
jgi:cytoskeletal protein RodZ